MNQLLTDGENTEVVVSPASRTKRPSAVDILAKVLGGLSFKTPEEAATCMKGEKASLDR